MFIISKYVRVLSFVPDLKQNQNLKQSPDSQILFTIKDVLILKNVLEFRKLFDLFKILQILKVLFALFKKCLDFF